MAKKAATFPEKKHIPRAENARAVGVDSKELQALADDFTAHGRDIHSFMMLRHGKVACEVYRKPYRADAAHMVYSVSKSFTSAAVGFAVEEGLLSLQTRFLDVFPEYRTEKEDAYLEKLTVYDLLTMQSGKNVSVMSDRTADSWLDDFVSSPWKSEPGTTFSYISENMYVLCCMIRRLTGEKVTDYLMPRLFAPLGIERPFWATCPSGTEAGGWGLMLKTEDMAKFGLCYLQHGEYNGRQVIPRHWVEESAKALADTTSEKSDLDSVEGYGLCFWRCGGLKSAYRADGMFSQFIVIMEQYDAVFVCTAGEIKEQEMRDTLWRHIPKCFTDAQSGKEDDTIPVTLPDYEMLRVMPRSFLEKKLDNRRITFSKPVVVNALGFPVSMITLPASFMEKDKGGNIDNVTFRFFENEAELSWSEGDEYNTVTLGLDGQYRISPIVIGQVRYTAFCHASWIADSVLEVRVRAIETVAERRLIFTFSADKVVLKPSFSPDAEKMLAGVKDFIPFVRLHAVRNLVDGIVGKLSDIVNSTLYGRLTDIQ